MQIFKRLEECYDCMVHPQKREDVLVMLELVIKRVVELKHALVKWNPPNPDVRRPQGALEENFPWEYVNLDDILVDLKLPPETLEARRARARACLRLAPSPRLPANVSARWSRDATCALAAAARRYRCRATSGRTRSSQCACATR
jgi:hypothetical protein